MTTFVANITDVSQFEPGESAYECGFYAVFQNRGAGEPGRKPTLSGEQIDQLADKAYTRFWGSNTPSDKNGMTLYQLYLLLQEPGTIYNQQLHYHPIKTDLSEIYGWLDHKYGVILCVQEASVYDLELGDTVPYSWKPSGNHIITAVGYGSYKDEKGETKPSVFCHDTASIAPSGVRKGPRPYNAELLKIVNATAVVYPWLLLPEPDDTAATVGTPRYGHSYTIQAGDTLSEIAWKEGTGLNTLIANNLSELDKVAREHGHPSSDVGNLIFPGTVLHW